MQALRAILAILLVATFASSPAALAADKVKTLQGTFQGIEEGDYFHWKMTDKTGQEHSFFILSPDKSLDAAVDNPDKFIGKPCTIKWKSSSVEIPEAGGKMDIDQIISVNWDAKG